MPFLAVLNGKKVVPEQVRDGIDVACHLCKQPMRTRKSHYRNGHFVARHFWHYTRGGSTCGGGGESREHIEMKSIALSKLKDEFPHKDAGLEELIGNRWADAFITFPEPHLPYGVGIAVEVQYKNKSKDIESTERNYFQKGYSVCWLEENDFSDNDVEIKKNIRPIWPAMAPNHNWDGGVTSTSQFGGKQRVIATPPWFCFIPPPNKWKNGPIDISKYGSEGRTGLHLPIPRATPKKLEVVLKELGGSAEIDSIWGRFVARQFNWGLGVKDVVAELERMPNVKKMSGFGVSGFGVYKLITVASEENGGKIPL